MDRLYEKGGIFQIPSDRKPGMKTLLQHVNLSFVFLFFPVCTKQTKRMDDVKQTNCGFVLRHKVKVERPFSFFSFS